MEPEKLLSTIRKEQGLPALPGRTLQASGQASITPRQGITVPQIPERPINRLPSTRASAENPIVTKGEPIKLPTQTDDRQKQVDLMVKSAKGEQFSDDDLRFLAESTLKARDVATGTTSPYKTPNETQDQYIQRGVKETGDLEFNGYAPLTSQDIANMTPDQRMAYQTDAYDQYTQDQMNMYDQFGTQQKQAYDQRIADTNNQIEQTRAAEEAKNKTLLDQYTQDQQAVAQSRKDEVMEAGAEGMEQLKRNLARRGMSRSTDADTAIVSATKNTQRLVDAIERETNTAIQGYQVQLLDKLDQKISKLEDRAMNLGDQAAAADLQLLKERQKTYSDLMTQSPRNPAKMIELADKLKAQQLDELKENREAQKDAAQNLQWTISTSGSGWLNTLSDDEINNLAANTGMNATTLRNMGKTLKEQENEWNKVKYAADQQWEQSKFQMEQDNKFAVENLKNTNDWQKELWKAAREDEKSNKALNSLLGAVGIDYASQANGATPSSLSYETPIPHPVSGKDVVEVNPSLAMAKPEGYKYKASNGSLSGQCAWYAEQLTNLNGKNWTIGNTINEKKNRIAQYAKQGLAFYPGQEQIQVGQTLITNDSKTYGHAAVVNGITSDGKLILSESNYAGPLKVTNTRVVDPNSKGIIGVLKTTPKPQYQIAKGAVAAAGSVLDKLGPLGKLASAAGKANPNIGESIAQTLGGLFGGQQKQIDLTFRPSDYSGQPTADQTVETTQPAQQPQGFQLSDTQVRGIDSLSDKEKQTIRAQAPEVWRAYIEQGGGKDQASLSEIRQTRKEVYSMPVVKNFEDLSKTYNNLDASYKSYKNGEIDKGIVDQGLVMLFNKMLDPTSAVREGEYARTAEGQSAIARAQQYFSQLKEGGAGITDKTRSDMVTLAQKLQGVAQDQFNKQMQFYVDYSKDLGTTPQNLLGSYYQYYQPSNNDSTLYNSFGSGGGSIQQSDLDFYNSL